MSASAHSESLIPAPIWKYARWPLWIGIWCACIWATYDRGHRCWHEFDTEKYGKEYERGDGNSGHTQIDFGGQWVMGRMIWEGHGYELYDRNRIRDVVRRGLPYEDEHATSQESIIPPSLRKRGATNATDRHDHEKMMGWLMGNDPHLHNYEFGKGIAVPLMGGSHGNPFVAAALQKISDEKLTPELAKELEKPIIGGALYPPIHGFYYAPLGAMRAQDGYRTLQMLSLLAAYIGGLAVRFMSRGRVWIPLATLIILMLPGVRPGLDLGQNQMISLMIILIGWALFVRDYEVGAGIIWGLMAFKPVWAISFILVPMLMGRLRFFVAMAATGASLILVTLPFVGIKTWQNWIEVGQLATGLYSTDQNWVRLSRDLAGVVRRLVVDTDIAPVPQSVAADWLAVILPGFVILGTAFVYLKRADRAKTLGIAPAFVLLAAYLGCYRFMYYDVTLSFAALAAFFATPRLWQKPTVLSIPTDATDNALSQRSYSVYLNSIPLLILCLLLILENWLLASQFRYMFMLDGFSRSAVNDFGVVSEYTPHLSGITNYYYPTDTYLLFALWLWLGWRLWRDGEQAS